MPYKPPGPPLASGPPERVGKTARENTEIINNLPFRPCWYNNRRAWNILGYDSSTKVNKDGKPHPKPSFQEFQTAMRSFWAHHARHDNTRKGRRARALVLDALRALGIRSMTWNSSMKSLGITSHDGTFALERCKPGEGTNGKNNSNLYQTMEPPKTYIQEHHSTGEFEIRQWQKYHRYQGFYATDRDPDDSVSVIDGTPKYEARYFRAIAMPEGPDSLWYALSYHTGGKRDCEPRIEGPYIASPWVTKMRIWTYFVQTLREPIHPRWKDYHILQHRSKRVVEGFGECSLLRSLYAGRDQGRPAYSAWPVGVNYDAIFHVVADYFGTQVVVFAIDACLPDIDPATNEEYVVDEDREVTMGEKPHILPYRSQASRGYQYRAYGQLRDGEYKQIFLATSDWKHFDAVDWDQPCHWQPSYFPKIWSDTTMDKKLPRLAGGPPKKLPNLTAQERMTFERPYEVDPVRIRKIPAPWWKSNPELRPAQQPPVHIIAVVNGRPPCQLAVYNRIERHYIPRDKEGKMVAEITQAIDLVEQENVVGWLASTPMAGKQPEEITLQDDEIIRHFIAHHDIPGWSFKMPPAEDIELWTVPHWKLTSVPVDKTTKEKRTATRVRKKAEEDMKLIKAELKDDFAGEKVEVTTKDDGEKAKTTVTTKKAPLKLMLPLDVVPPEVNEKPVQGHVRKYIRKEPNYKQVATFYHTDDPDSRKYQIRFGPPPQTEDGKIDTSLKGENLALIGLPEIQFADVDDLRYA